MERMALSVAEVQEALGIGRNAVYSLVNQANFPAIRLNGGRRILIPRDAFLRWLDQQTAESIGG